MTTLVKATAKGQITLPTKWRKAMATDMFVVEERKGMLHIKPARATTKGRAKWTTVFSAKRDNGGKGVPAKTMIRLIGKIQRS